MKQWGSRTGKRTICSAVLTLFLFPSPVDAQGIVPAGSGFILGSNAVPNAPLSPPPGATGAGAVCASPAAPPVVASGSTASADRMIQAAKDAVAFIRASDVYQLCLKTELDNTERQLRSVDPAHDSDGSIRKSFLAAEKMLNAKADASQKEKERIGKAYNTAAAAYKAARK